MAELLAPIGVVATVLSGAAASKQAFWDPLRVKDVLSGKTVDEIIVALNEAVQKLGCIKEDFKHEVLRNKTAMPSYRYSKWVNTVEKIDNQVKDLIAAYNKKKEKASLFPSFGGFKKDFKEMYKNVISLGQESNQIEDKMFIGLLPERVAYMKGTNINFGTRGIQIKEILDLLVSPKAKKIGILGTVGIGKTTMMRNLNNHEKVAQTFEIVICLTVSKEGSRENLSREDLLHAIVKRLKLNNVDEVTTSNADEVAGRILMELQDKKYLLLLDDVKECLDLKNIGIPESNNGCKIVLTTRLHRVCAKMVDRIINVTYLSTYEAWKMFQDVLKSVGVLEDQKIQKLARRVCEECSGLPLLIQIVASTFRWKNTEKLWSDGLNSWRMWPAEDREGIEEIYSMLKFCYDDLRTEPRQKCFLYGALYPEGSGINVDYLLECWAAEKLLGGDDSITQESLICGHLVLSHLKSVSLLEDGEIENHVTMHKFIRQLALYIAEGDGESKYMVKTRNGLPKPPKVEDWTEKKWVSFVDNKLKDLPDSPNCSMLSTLFLQRNLSLETIPQSFFEHMIELRVLDVSDTGIKELPKSLSTSIELKVLYLNNCESLVELPSHIVEKLTYLEALDIVGSGVNNIPSHIKKLTRLRRLRVSFPESGNENATHEVNSNCEVVSKLSRLEELVIHVKSPENRSNDVVESIVKAVATLQEFKSLKFYFLDKVVDVIEVVGSQSLRIRVPDVTILLNFIKESSWGNVRDIKYFEFYIGSKKSEHPKLPNFDEYAKYVKYCEVEGTRILEVLAEADAFELVDNNNIEQLSDSELTSMKGIQSCLIEGCNAIKTIVGTSDIVVLPSLEHLFMKNLKMLKSIFKVPFQSGSLTKLTTLKLTGCRNLVTIFPPDSGAGRILLPELKKMTLLDMGKLESICASELNWPSLEELEIFECPSLLKLPFNRDNAKILKRIDADPEWWGKLQFDQNNENKEWFQKLRNLRYPKNAS